MTVRLCLFSTMIHGWFYRNKSGFRDALRAATQEPAGRIPKGM